jgi:hypothetical protein
MHHPCGEKAMTLRDKLAMLAVAGGLVMAALPSQADAFWGHHRRAATVYSVPTVPVAVAQPVVVSRPVIVGYAPTYVAPATTTYYAPAPITTYYAPAPVTTYYAPAAPVRTFYAPAAPVTTYYAPAPVTTYYAPAPTVVAPAIFVP